MKTIRYIAGIALSAIMSLTLAVPTASAQTVDITIFDGSANAIYGTDPRGIWESGETEANTETNRFWDLRAFGWNSETKKLTIVSGFDPFTVGPFKLGDMFIDTKNSHVVPSRPSLADGYIVYSNSMAGFEYCVDFHGKDSQGRLGYNIVELSGASTLVSGFYGQNSRSDPASLLGSSNDMIVALGGFAEVTTFTDAEVFTELGINVGTNGGTNYVWSIDLTPIAPSLTDGAIVHLTQTCGNDLIRGQVPAQLAVIPEPSSCLMACLGLTSLALRRQRKM